jgi:hypothetical protein
MIEEIYLSNDVNQEHESFKLPHLLSFHSAASPLQLAGGSKSNSSSLVETDIDTSSNARGEVAPMSSEEEMDAELEETVLYRDINIHPHEASVLSAISSSNLSVLTPEVMQQQTIKYLENLSLTLELDWESVCRRFELQYKATFSVSKKVFITRVCSDLPY